MILFRIEILNLKFENSSVKKWKIIEHSGYQIRFINFKKSILLFYHISISNILKKIYKIKNKNIGF